jgi:serine/threonine-protein kinase HipA
MKFALAVGDNRHYVLSEIMPRHFVQTAAKSGVPASFVQNIFHEILEAGEAVIDKVMKELPGGFPQELTDSIVGGLLARLRLVRAPTRLRRSSARRPIRSSHDSK